MVKNRKQGGIQKQQKTISADDRDNRSIQRIEMPHSSQLKAPVINSPIWKNLVVLAALIPAVASIIVAVIQISHSSSPTPVEQEKSSTNRIERIRKMHKHRLREREVSAIQKWSSGSRTNIRMNP